MVAKLDRYVASAVLGAYFAALFFLVTMFIVFDLLFEMDTYIDVASDSGVGVLSLAMQLLEYQIVRLPFVYVTIAPFVTVIACMFALSRIMAANEVVPMLFTGRSMFRVLRPMIGVAVLSAFLMGFTWQWVIPSVAESYEQIGSGLTGREASLKRVTLRASDPRTELFIWNYKHREHNMEGVQKYDRGSRSGDAVLLRADSAHYNPELSDWELVNGKKIWFEGDQKHTEDLDMLGMEGLTPKRIMDSGKAQRQTTELSYTELGELMRLRPGRSDYVLALHAHFTFPLANLVLLFLAVPFAVNFERGRRIERVVFAILICAGYLVADLICQSLVYKSFIHPVLAAWTPTIVFGSLGIVVASSMRT